MNTTTNTYTKTLKKGLLPLLFLAANFLYPKYLPAGPVTAAAIDGTQNNISYQLDNSNGDTLVFTCDNDCTVPCKEGGYEHSTMDKKLKSMMSSSSINTKENRDLMNNEIQKVPSLYNEYIVDYIGPTKITIMGNTVYIGIVIYVTSADGKKGIKRKTTKVILKEDGIGDRGVGERSTQQVIKVYSIDDLFSSEDTEFSQVIEGNNNQDMINKMMYMINALRGEMSKLDINDGKITNYKVFTDQLPSIIPSGDKKNNSYYQKDLNRPLLDNSNNMRSNFPVFWN